MTEIYCYLLEELSRVYLSATDEKVYEKYKNEISNTIIPSINQQLKLYEKTSIESIQQEIYEELMKEINFDKYQEEITDDFRDKNFQITRYKSINIPKFKSTIPQISIEEFEKLRSNKSDLDSYCRKIMKDVNIYNNDLIHYKNELKNYLFSTLEYLKLSYEKIIINKQNNFLISNSKRIEIDLSSFRNFVKQVIEEILEI